MIARFRKENEFEKVILLVKKKFFKDSFCIDFLSKTSFSISNGNYPKIDYCFDTIYNGNIDQNSFFKEVAFSTIEDVLKGYNGTIFTYGQSGSGKTYTMFGDDIYDVEKKGIIPRAM